MFPHITTQQRSLAFHQWAVLVGGGMDFEHAIAYRKPGPATAEAGEAGVVEFFFEGRKAAKGIDEYLRRP